MQDKKPSKYAYLSTFALAFGCIIGWGCFSMPSKEFIPKAGVVGVLIGIVLAGAISLIVCCNYIGLSKVDPDAKSSYQLIKKAFGLDHAYFSAWSLLLAYLCIFWANVQGMANIGRFIFADTLESRPHYNIMGCDVYLLDVVICFLVIVICAVIVSRGYKVTMAVITVLSIGLLVSIVILFLGILLYADPTQLYYPAFSASSTISKPLKILSIVVLAPWLFVGFELVSHTNGKSGLPINRTFICAGVAIVAGMAAYCMMVIVENADIPGGYRSWEDYVAATGGANTSFEAISAFYGVYEYLGTFGAVILIIAIFCALFGLTLGYLVISTHTIIILADDDLSVRIFRSEHKNAPVRVLIFIGLISIPITLLGMNVARWAVNVSTLAIAIVYAYISLGAFFKSPDSKLFRISGIIGAVCSISIFCLMIIPNNIIESYLSNEDYLILSVWAFSGLVCYRFVLSMDSRNRLGRSMIMWLLLFFLLFYSTNMYTHFRMEEALIANTDPGQIPPILTTNNLTRTIVIVIGLIILFELFSIMLKRNKEMASKIANAKKLDRAKSSLLSNMSHDIRTPLNAIVGFTDLALQDKDDPQKMSSYLEKIKFSCAHLLGLINDVLEMSHIEGGNVELKEIPVNLPSLLSELNDHSFGGLETKECRILMDIHQMDNENVMCDPGRLRQALTYLFSNAIKYTPEGGSVVIGAMQVTPSTDNRATYEIYIRDGGKEMPEELIRAIKAPDDSFGGYTASDTQGSIVGVLLAKRLIELMDGRVEVEKEADGTTEVYISLELTITDTIKKAQSGETSIELYGKRALVVDDIMINRQIAVAILKFYGMDSEEAKDGQEAVDMLKSALPGHFDVILMDIQMPNLNGFDAAKQIREIDDPINSTVPILAMTANVFDEDKDKAIESGMNDFIPKPIDRETLISKLTGVLRYAYRGE